LVLLAWRVGSRQGVASHEIPALTIAIGEGIALGIAALLVAIAVTRAGVLRAGEAGDGDPARVRARPYASLFLISFVALFVELMLIRYCNSQIRIFSFYKNVPLIGCFLGLGMGCCLARGSGRHALLFLLWLVPVAVFLSAGSLLLSNALGKMAAIGSAEHILGDFVPRAADAQRELISQMAVAGFCVTTLVVITLLFGLLGRLLGEAFEQVARLPGYTVNIVGSLAGILGFLALSYLEMSPWVWFAAGLAPLLWWFGRAAQLGAGIALMALVVAAVAPSYGETVWSRYQKLVGHRVPLPAMGPRVEGYLVEISDVFYQVAVDRSPEALARSGSDPLPHYGAIWRELPRPERVLVVGSGTGNDVAAALHAGAGQVDAVDIDPAIVEMGRRHHPERPYADPRVRVIVDDARHAFRQLPPDSYDAVIFGLLDSHTQLGMSSVRLDNYVFTTESLAEARQLVKPGGHLVITAATFNPWFRERFERMLGMAVGDEIRKLQHGVWSTFIGRVGRRITRGAPDREEALPSDDWPFLYLPTRSVPTAYLWVVASMAVASVLVLRTGGLSLGRFTSYHGHLFFLGAAFLLMEVHAINRLALLFGTTWMVSAVTIALVLVLIVCANLTVIAFHRIPYALSYGGLAASLAVSFLIDPGMVLGAGAGAALGFGLVLLSPVYFAGLVFARSFRVADLAAPAIGANILGSVLGGWIEYGTMALGMRALVLLAATFYLCSLAMLVVAQRAGRLDAGAIEARTRAGGA
jgi:SAM-dependent methyltransferase